MPVDELPTADGSVVIVDGMGKVLKKDLFEQPATGERFTSHFATCTSPELYRKKKVKEKP